MLVLLAIDGSVPSHHALELVEHINWPAGSTVRVVAAVMTPMPIVTGPGQYVDPESIAVIEQVRVDAARRLVEEAAAAIRRNGLTVDAAVLHGPPAGAILDDAAACGADLAVVGSRGHSTLGSLLLGSVSAALVDHAPCPTLVARKLALHRMLVALDGSAAAGEALEVVATWPIFRPIQVTVLTVIAPEPLIGGATVPAVEDKLEAAIARLEAQRREHASQLVAAAAERLGAAGINATGRVVEGDPAHAIVEAADAEGADLIVLGSRGLTGLTRLRLGSVARGVLHAASASVMVVHERPSGGALR